MEMLLAELDIREEIIAKSHRLDLFPEPLGLSLRLPFQVDLIGRMHQQEDPAGFLADDVRH